MPPRYHDAAFAADAALDAAVSRAVLERVAEGALPETLRVHRPGDVVAFSPLDTVKPGFAAAREAARAGGFDAVRRLAGGRAAVFHRETLAFAWCLPASDPRRGIHERFEEAAARVARALGRLGVDARVGEVSGEYCPGAHSVNARGKRKLMGVGQRIVRGAAHVGGVLVVRDSERVREILTPIYAAFGLRFDPETAGSVEDEIGPVTRADVAAALLDEFGSPDPTPLDPATLARAHELAPDHRL